MERAVLLAKVLEGNVYISTDEVDRAVGVLQDCLETAYLGEPVRVVQCAADAAGPSPVSPSPWGSDSLARAVLGRHDLGHQGSKTYRDRPGKETWLVEPSLFTKAISEEPEMLESPKAGRSPETKRSPSSPRKGTARAHFDDEPPPDDALLSFETVPSTVVLVGLEKTSISQLELAEILSERSIQIQGDERRPLPRPFLLVVVVPTGTLLAKHLMDHFIVGWSGECGGESLGLYDRPRLDRVRRIGRELHHSHHFAVQLRDLAVALRLTPMYASGIGARAMTELEDVLRACSALELEAMEAPAMDDGSFSGTSKGKEADLSSTSDFIYSATSSTSLAPSIHRRPGLRPTMLQTACLLCWGHRIRLRAPEDERRVMYGADVDEIKKSRLAAGLQGPVAVSLGARLCLLEALGSLGLV